MESRLIRQVSLIPEDQLALKAVYGPLGQDLTHIYTVRGVVVSRLQITKIDGDRSYRLCVFPDFSQRWVNEGNLIGKRINRYAGGIK
jgi:hypothetical protein